MNTVTDLARVRSTKAQEQKQEKGISCNGRAFPIEAEIVSLTEYRESLSIKNQSVAVLKTERCECCGIDTGIPSHLLANDPTRNDTRSSVTGSHFVDGDLYGQLCNICYGRLFFMG